jgi:sarcosine oxidase, subunit gamma
MVESAIRRTPTVATTAWLSALPPAARFAFYGDAKARAAALPVWGPAFSEEACRANVQTTRATLWLGPDEYLLLDFGGAELGADPLAGGQASAGEPGTSHLAGGQASSGESVAGAMAAGPPSTSTLGALERALADIPHALVDISHRQFALEVSGPHAATILNGACPLDLDLAEFPVGMCTRTVLAKADIVLWRTRPDVFHLEVWRSFAGYVTGILSEIAAEFYQPQ